MTNIEEAFIATATIIDEIKLNPNLGNLEYFTTVRDALEKQIFNPVEYTAFHDGCVTCNNCHKSIPLYDHYITSEWIKDNHYCRHCGQKIYGGKDL